MFELKFISLEKETGSGKEGEKMNNLELGKEKTLRERDLKSISPMKKSNTALNERLGETSTRPVARATVITMHPPVIKAQNESDQTKKRSIVDDTQILRFKESERWLHWSIAVPFMVCWLSAAILGVIYNPSPQLPFRDVFSWIHRISAICLVVLPIVSIFRGRKEYRMHLYNIKTGWSWSRNDLKWLALMLPAAFSKKFVLPEQDKFNAAEKINFISGMVGLPVFIVTGVMIWLHLWAWMAWLVHVGVALMMTPTILGHIFMATINPDTRTGLSGMISGYVDRHWAKHHYGTWYREQFEENIAADPVAPHVERPLSHRIYMNCVACRKKLSISRSGLLEIIMSVRSLACPKCGTTFAAISVANDDQLLQWTLKEFEKRGLELYPRRKVSMR